RAGEGARRHDQRARQVNPPGAASTGEVPILCADGHLTRRVARARSGLDAGAAGRINELGAHAFEEPDVAFLFRVAPDALRAELDVEAPPRCDALPARRGLREHARVHVHIGPLASGARASVGDVDLHINAQAGEGDAVARVARG